MIAELQIYDSLSKQKQRFIPIKPREVTIYVCGMTVYDYCHLGHARVLVVFDMIVRYFRAIGYQVTYIRNITDIDDKIIARANENQESIQTLTQRFIQAMTDDSKALGVLPPDNEPKATDAMPDIIAMVQKLIENGYAYPADNGDVYYSVHQFKEYGQLSGENIDELRAGERVAIDSYKQDPLDFVLWKASKPNEPSWSSPWGFGRPGWHIECSAMSVEHLGTHFDIHGGGMDLKFPHHENEIAQSKACGHRFANYWLHNGFIRIDNEKMSKSLGNFFTVRAVLKHYRAEVVRYFILNSHYRSPLDYSDQELELSKVALTRLYITLRGFDLKTIELDADITWVSRFHQAMLDDFNTPQALAVLFELSHEINYQRQQQTDTAKKLANLLYTLAGILGLLQTDVEQFLQQGQSSTQEGIDSEWVLAKIEERQQARQDKNWALADQIREELTAKGVILEDTAGKTSWRMA